MTTIEFSTSELTMIYDCVQYDLSKVHSSVYELEKTLKEQNKQPMEDGVYVYGYRKMKDLQKLVDKIYTKLYPSL